MNAIASNRNNGLDKRRCAIAITIVEKAAVVTEARVFGGSASNDDVTTAWPAAGTEVRQ